MEYSILAAFFVLGLLVGSFLNVVIFRLNTGSDFVHTRSRCFSCGKVLQWYELIPLVSFSIQKGRCRKCKSKISLQYPIVELATGFLFVAIALKMFNVFDAYHTPYAAYYIFTLSLLLAIVVYDVRHKIIPNALVYSFIALSFLGLFSIFSSQGVLLPISDFRFQISDFFTGIIFFVLFALLWLLSRGRWMGFGDAKLVLGLGWLLGPALGTAALVLSFWIGAAFGLGMLAFNRLFSGHSRDIISLQSEVPFAPFLILGTFLAFFFGITFYDLQNLLVLYVF